MWFGQVLYSSPLRTLLLLFLPQKIVWLTNHILPETLFPPGTNTVCINFKKGGYQRAQKAFNSNPWHVLPINSLPQSPHRYLSDWEFYSFFFCRLRFYERNWCYYHPAITIWNLISCASKVLPHLKSLESQSECWFSY